MYVQIETLDKDAPDMSKDDAVNYTKSLMLDAARETIRYSYEWRRYADHDQGVSEADRDNNNTFWEKVSSEFKSKIAKVTGQAIYGKILAAMGRNKWLRLAKDDISLADARDMVEDCINEEVDIRRTAKQSAKDYQRRVYPSPTVSDKDATPSGSVVIDIGHANQNAKSMTYSDQVIAIAQVAKNDIIKAFASRPKAEDFVPKTREDLELFRSHGIVPEGFLSRAQVNDICPLCGDEMAKAHMPIITEDRFRRDIALRVALDISTNSEMWAKAILLAGNIDIIEDLSKCEDAADYNLFKAEDDSMPIIDDSDQQSGAEICCGSKETYSSKAEFIDLMKGSKAVPKANQEIPKKGGDPIPIIGQGLDLVDFVKANPGKVVAGWATKMKKEGGKHPFTYCVKKAKDFASDPAAFCAAAHMEAFGTTPAERTKAKKGDKI